MLAHGYGCDQLMWRFLVPAFQNEYRLVLFDHVGAGKSDLSHYNRERYGTLNGYADDVLEIIEAVVGGAGHFRRSLGEWNDRGARRQQEARRFRAAGPDRPITLLHQRGDYSGGFSGMTSRGCCRRWMKTILDGRAPWRRSL